MEINIANVGVVIGLFTVRGFIFKYLDKKISSLKAEMAGMKGNYLARFESVREDITENRIEIIREIAILRAENKENFVQLNLILSKYLKNSDKKAKKAKK